MDDKHLQLILKEIEDTLSPNERIDLDSWLSESGENVAAYQAVNIAWIGTGKLDSTIEINLDDEYISLKKKMNPGAEDAPKDASIKWIRPLSIAAGLVLLFGFILLIRSNLNSDQVAWIEIETKSEARKIDLPDKSIVHVNKHSALRYPKTFDGERHLTMLRGEAHFDVVHDDDKEFVVKTKNSTIHVLGTSFAVKDQGDLVSVQVTSGKVLFESKSNQSNIELTPGNNATLNAEGVFQRNVISINEIAWHSRYIEFEKLSLRDAIFFLNEHYNSTITVVNPSILDCTITASFDDKSIDYTLETITTILTATLNQNSNNSFEIIGGRCH